MMAKSAMNVGFAACAMIAAAMLSSCAAGPNRHMSGSAFEAGTKISDDPMETKVLLVSPDLRLPTGDWLGEFSRKLFIGAGVERKTGTTRVLISVEIQHQYGTPLRFLGATYETAAGDVVDAATFQARPVKVDRCSSSGCSYTESASFAIPEEELQRIQDGMRPWPVRFKTSRLNIDGAFEHDQIQAFKRQLEAAQKLASRGR